MRVCVGHIAERTVFTGCLCLEGKGHDRVVAALRLHFGKIKAVRVYARRRAGFKAAQLDAERLQALGKAVRRECPVRTALTLVIADHNLALQVRARADDDRACAVERPQMRPYCADCAVLCEHLGDFSLLEVEIFLRLEPLFHLAVIAFTVNLRAQRMNRRAFAAV